MHFSNLAYEFQCESHFPSRKILEDTGPIFLHRKPYSARPPGARMRWPSWVLAALLRV